MRHLVSRLLILALLVLSAYNAWQVSRLGAEVADLKVQVAALKTSRSVGSRDDVENSLIAKAQMHAGRAKEAILRGDFKKGRIEIEKSLQFMEQAGKDATAPSRGTLDKLQRSIDETRAVLNRVWQQSPQSPHSKEEKKAAAK